MPRQLPEYFKEKELAPLCLAVNRNEARRIESVLDGSAIDYTFEITSTAKRGLLSILFGSLKKGVMFLVPAEQCQFCKNLLEKAGLSYLVVKAAALS